MARLIRFDGRHETVEPADKEHGFSLEELYTLIGCDMIEAVRLAPGVVMIVDENGKMRKDATARHNEAATIILHGARGPGDWITGNVVICDSKEFQ